MCVSKLESNDTHVQRKWLSEYRQLPLLVSGKRKPDAVFCPRRALSKRKEEFEVELDRVYFKRMSEMLVNRATDRSIDPNSQSIMAEPNVTHSVALT